MAASAALHAVLRRRRGSAFFRARLELAVSGVWVVEGVAHRRVRCAASGVLGDGVVGRGCERGAQGVPRRARRARQGVGIGPGRRAPPALGGASRGPSLQVRGLLFLARVERLAARTCLGLGFGVLGMNKQNLLEHA